MALHPYLFFTNTAREAMTRYHEILGGELEIMSAADLPPTEDMPFEAPADFVIHAALTLGDGALLMASDDATGDGSGVKGAAITLTLDDPDEARRVFDAFAEGGRIDMALGETFWSPLFGSCVDRFGVAWMIDVAPATQSVVRSADEA
jgi:PhnB protein